MGGSRRLITPIAVAIVAVLAVGSYTALKRESASGGREVTAHFTRTVGLYPGSSVRVLGVAIGTVKSIVPDGSTVLVRFVVNDGVQVPAQAQAVIIPPSLVSDRYVQLVPAYTSGPELADGADIPLTRTHVPVELDEILSSLDTVFTALGPNGADATGSLNELVKVGARALKDGGGAALNSTITQLAGAIGTLASSRDDVAGVLENLAAFTTTLARNDAPLRRLTHDLGTVSQQLAGERKALEQALANLSVALGDVASLVRDHRSSLVRDIDSLAQVTKTVLKEKQSLMEALDDTPLLFANLAEVFNTDRHTLDIRQDNEQGGQLYSIAVCQLLAPLLNISCPPSPVAATATPTANAPDALLARLSLAGMLAVRR